MDNQIGLTQLACIEKAQQLFPSLNQDSELLEAKQKSESTNSDLELGEFRMVSTGKFIWDVSLPLPMQAHLTCTGDFNTRHIETLNYNGLDKRPALNEVWDIPNMQNWPSEADAIAAQNMEDLQ